MPVCNSSLRQIIWRELDIDAVAHQDADAVSSHTPRDRREDNVLTIVDLNFKKCVRLFVYDNASQFDQFFFHLRTRSLRPISPTHFHYSKDK